MARLPIRQNAMRGAIAFERYCLEERGLAITKRERELLIW